MLSSYFDAFLKFLWYAKILYQFSVQIFVH